MMRIGSRFLAVQLLFGSVWIGLDSSAQTGVQFPNIIRKKAAVSQSALSWARQEVSVNITGLQPGDVINLRPSEEAEVAGAAGTVLSRRIGERFDPTAGGLLSPGGDLPQGSLGVTATQVVFSRPNSVEGNAFLDLKVPGTAQVVLRVDGIRVLSALLLKPVFFCDGEWSLGAEGVAATLLRATGLLRQPDSAAAEPAFNKNTGLYTVSNSKVRVARRTSLAGRSGLTALVLVNVDETGRVTKATPLTASGINNLSDALLQWRFMPYLVNGRAIPFEACISVSVQ